MSSGGRVDPPPAAAQPGGEASKSPVGATPDELLRRATAAYRQVTCVSGDGDVLRMRIVRTLEHRRHVRRRWFMATAPVAVLVVATFALLYSSRLRGAARVLWGGGWSTIRRR